MKSVYSLIIYWVSMLTTVACGQKTFDEKMKSLYRNTVPLIDASSLQKLANQDQQIFLLDTRSQAEYRVSHIPGARLIDYDHFEKRDVKDIPKDAKVVVYCSVGYRSERIGEKLQKMGFDDVSNLYGGIFDWKNQGKEIINLENNPTDSVHTYNKNWSQWLYNGIKVYE